ncbi:glycerophosphodiester phosphodiesterase [Marmoricola endophyticus]|uniref:glycerophosphodiester phosphodiesterase n=1 Tax=Marmoricola endophyticus TaxID=2040280 RepID=UPI00166B1670|nr:glycerophosphodiester phosphodiesterase [Marmoricola endophyticus]
MPDGRPRVPRTGFAYLDEPSYPLAIAHRGGARHPDLAGLENTLAAFEHAVGLGYRYLETDVHLSRDGVLVVSHDGVLGRLTDHAGRISDLTAADLARVRVAGDHPLPTMAELLERFPEARFNIDIKGADTAVPLAVLLRTTGAERRVCVGSFSLSRLREFRRATGGRVATSAAPVEVAGFLAPDLGAGTRRGLSDVLAAGRRLVGGRAAPVALQVPVRRGPFPVVTEGLVDRAHAGGLHVHVWTVDDRDEMARLLDLGVDGLITDRTDVLRDLLVERDQWDDTGAGHQGYEEET